MAAEPLYEPRTEITFDVDVKSLEGLPHRSIFHAYKKRKLYVALNVGLSSKKTREKTRGEDENVSWDESFTFTVPIESNSKNSKPPLANFAIYHAHGYANHEVIAEARDVDLTKLSQAKAYPIPLYEPHSEGENHGRLIVMVRLHLPRLEGSVGGSPIQPSTRPFSELVKIGSGLQSYQSFLKAFQKAVELARSISELDPTAKIALGAISFALKAIVDQVERDQRVNELQEEMSFLLLFFSDIRTLRQSPFLQDVLRRLLRQVSECTYFIFQYQEIESFTNRGSPHRRYRYNPGSVLYNFAALRAELALGTSLQTAINTDYILNRVEEIDAFLHIGRLEYLRGTGWRMDKQCPPNTRDFTINRIHRWISRFQPGLFVLKGPERSEKSAILHRVAIALSETGRLGACVFLNEHTKGEKTADSVMWTILYELAMSNKTLGWRIALAIIKQPSLVSADATYFESFLKNFAKDLVLYGPLVVIVDGLHTLANPQDQELLYALLGRVAIATHHKFRFIISTRSTPYFSHEHVYWAVNHAGFPSDESDTLLQNCFADQPVDGMPEPDHLNPNDLRALISQCSMGSLEWLEIVYDVLDIFPDTAKLFLDGIRLYAHLAASEKDALYLLGTIIFHMLPVLDHDFYCAPTQSRVFIQSGKANHRLHELGVLKPLERSRIECFNEYEIKLDAVSCLSKVLSSRRHISLLPTTGDSLNIYQICLREASTSEKSGPVYARFALPTKKPLLDGRNIESQLEKYGVNRSDLKNMSARSPPEGCEWIIFHHGLFPGEKEDGYSSSTVTTPVLTQAILERLTCIWVDWFRDFKDETCLRLRDGMKESNFLGSSSFTDITYHGSRVELICNGKSKGDLMPGDQIQVKSAVKYGRRPWAVIALALRY